MGQEPAYQFAWLHSSSGEKIRYTHSLISKLLEGDTEPLCSCCRHVSRWHGQIVYIESIARVKSLSLSGNILYHLRIADLFLVQWPVLQEIYPWSKHCGRLY